jgi:hypothetical protein
VRDDVRTVSAREWRAVREGETHAATRTSTNNTPESFIVGIGASGAVLAGAAIVFVTLVGIVSFNVWPTSKDATGGADGNVELSAATKTATHHASVAPVSAASGLIASTTGAAGATTGAGNAGAGGAGSGNTGGQQGGSGGGGDKGSKPSPPSTTLTTPATPPPSGDTGDSDSGSSDGSDGSGTPPVQAGKDPAHPVHPTHPDHPHQNVPIGSKEPVGGDTDVTGKGPFTKPTHGSSSSHGSSSDTSSDSSPDSSSDSSSHRWGHRSSRSRH